VPSGGKPGSKRFLYKVHEYKRIVKGNNGNLYRASGRYPEGIKCGRLHILVYMPKKEESAMCQSIQTQQPAQTPPERKGDVDDLIFRHETEWLASDR
jgi:hypothetical protein